MSCRKKTQPATISITGKAPTGGVARGEAVRIAAGLFEIIDRILAAPKRLPPQNRSRLRPRPATPPRHRAALLRRRARPRRCPQLSQPALVSSPTLSALLHFGHLARSMKKSTGLQRPSSLA